MLDNLVESKKYAGESRKFRGLFGLTAVLMAAVLTAGLVASLFSQELSLGAGDLELSTLVAPVEMPPEKPPIEIPEKQPRSNSAKKENKLPTRKFNIQRTDETPVKVPDKISVTPSANKARPNSYFKLSNVDSPGKMETPGGRERGNAGNSGEAIKPKPNVIAKNDDEKEETPPPVLKKKETPKVEKVPPMISTGVVNGKAINLVKPIYSAAARSVGAKGSVKVQVMISEDGNVVSASVVDGHPLLRGSALQAAKSSKFSPTFLSGQKVKVQGFIIYNFAG